MRGEVSVAESYESDAFEPTDELLRRAERRWHVRRIIRLDHEVGPPSRTRHVEVAVMGLGEVCSTSGHLLDLEQPDLRDHLFRGGDVRGSAA
ncbi:hypothetical protein ACQPZJ_36895 [Actinoplanes sp. CA-054009]